MADFQAGLSRFAEKGIQIIGGSADSETEAAAMKQEHGIEFPLAYGLDVASFSKLTGAFVSQDGSYLHATAFIIKPDGLVDLAVYSTGSVGRLTAKEAAGMIKWRMGQAS